MNLSKRRRIAAQVLNCALKRVGFMPDALAEIKAAITKAEIRRLINQGKIFEHPSLGISYGRTRKRARQKRKGLRAGKGSRKGAKGARTPPKTLWIHKIRAQRRLLTQLKKDGAIAQKTYRELYNKASGGFFRNKRHISLYVEEQELLLKKQ